MNISNIAMSTSKQRIYAPPYKIKMRSVLILSSFVLLFSVLAFEFHLESTWQRDSEFMSLPYHKRTGYRRLHEGIQSSGKLDIDSDKSLSQSHDVNMVASIATKQSGRCSCYDDFSSPYCCQRALIGVYNMGLSAVDAVRWRLNLREVASPEFFAEHQYGMLFKAAFESPLVDYRHAVVTRNWYDSIVYGYLFHKSGRDCWLDTGGNPGYSGWLLNNTHENWEERLLNKSHRWWPRGNGRDLCQYLAEESEEVGMRIYTAWSLACFLNPLLDFRRQRADVELRQRKNQTLFLCYDNFIDPASSAVTEAYLWLYPNRTLKNKIRFPKYYRAHDFSQLEKDRLKGTLKRIDVEFHNGMLAKGSAEFGCDDQPHTSLK